MRKWFSLTIIAALLLTSLMGSSTRGVAQDRNANATSITPTPVSQEIQLANPVYLPLVASEQGTSDSAQQLAEMVSTAAVVLGEEPQLETNGKEANREDDLSAGQVPPAPGMEPPLDSLDDKANTLEEESIESAAADGWVTIKSEGFEGAFPNTGWRVLDSSGTTNGEYYWDDTSYTRYAGSWSAWPAKGGANALNPNSYNYPNNMRSWMIYGPFDLSNATDANLQFYYWNRSETNYDYFQWLASVNGTNFYGYQTSGDSGGWRSVNFNLKAVPTLGNLTGRSAVWIAFYFISDGSVTYKGPFVDNISLQKLVNTTVNCPNQYKAEYFNNRTLSGSPTVTRCENWPINYNWGNGSPVSGVGSDNFSVRWTGTANMNAGTYTFKATADDGIRAWLDNSLIIDAWRDQGPTEYSATRTVSSGNHSIKIEYYENGGGAVAAFRWDATTTKKVVLDPGHGWCVGTPGANCTIAPGAVGNNMKEKDIVLDIAQRTKTLLEARGVQVFMTRTGDDPYHTLSYASQYVNSKAPDLSISIHANAGGGTGTEACYQDNKGTTTQSRDISTRMTNEIASRLTLTNRGIFSEYYS